MEKVQGQKILDSLAISASTLCVLHCLVTPFLLILVPVISSTFVADELFHKIFVAFILPISIVALFLGCRRHRDRIVLILGSIGLACLVIVAAMGHEFFGEFGEKIGTVIGGMILVTGHIRNYYLCRQDVCDA